MDECFADWDRAQCDAERGQWCGDNESGEPEQEPQNTEQPADGSTVNITTYDIQLFESTDCTGTPSSIMHLAMNVCMRSGETEWRVYSCQDGQPQITEYSDALCKTIKVDTKDDMRAGVCEQTDESSIKATQCSAAEKNMRCTYNSACTKGEYNFYECYTDCALLSTYTRVATVCDFVSTMARLGRYTREKLSEIAAGLDKLNQTRWTTFGDMDKLLAEACFGMVEKLGNSSMLVRSGCRKRVRAVM